MSNSWDQLAGRIERFVDVGASKFVVVPMAEPDAPDEWSADLAAAAEALLPIER